MKLSRRNFLPLLAGSPFLFSRAHLGPQRMASRNFTPTPRGKPSGIPFLARFTDVAEAAGLTAPTIYGGISRKDYIVETMGCGCAFFDYDNDGWLDVLVLCGTRFGEAPRGATNRLYHNNRDGTFTDVTERAGLVRTGWASGVAVGDYDNDGYEDLFVTYWGEDVLYHNNGNGTFTEVAKKAGVIGLPQRWSTGCAFLDYDRDGRLDLFVSHYLKFDLKTALDPGSNPYCVFMGIAVN